MPIKIEVTDSIQVIDIACFNTSDRLVGRALFVVPEEHEVILLYDICIYEEKDRRKGYAQRIIKRAQEMFDYIVTGVESNAGKELCIKCGFVARPKLFKKAAEVLIWQSGTKKESMENFKQKQLKASEN